MDAMSRSHYSNINRRESMRHREKTDQEYRDRYAVLLDDEHERRVAESQRLVMDARNKLDAAAGLLHGLSAGPHALWDVRRLSDEIGRLERDLVKWTPPGGPIFRAPIAVGSSHAEPVGHGEGVADGEGAGPITPGPLDSRAPARKE